MTTLSRHAFSLLAIGAVAAGASPASAQITNLKRSSATVMTHVTFGYLCEDTFVLRNEGDSPVEATLGVEKGTEQVPVSLGPREQVEFTSTAKQDVQLWIDGKLVAKAEKDRRKCTDVQGNASVSVSPLEIATRDDGDRRSRLNYPFADPWFYGWGPGWGWGWGYGYGWGAPFARGVVTVPIIVGRGGRRR